MACPNMKHGSKFGHKHKAPFAFETRTRLLVTQHTNTHRPMLRSRIRRATRLSNSKPGFDLGPKMQDAGPNLVRPSCLDPQTVFLALEATCRNKIKRKFNVFCWGLGDVPQLNSACKGILLQRLAEAKRNPREGNGLPWTWACLRRSRATGSALGRSTLFSTGTISSANRLSTTWGGSQQARKASWNASGQGNL